MDTLSDLELIEGLDTIRTEIMKSPNVRKRLARISEDPRLQNLNRAQVKKMGALAREYSYKLKVNAAGKIVLEDKADVDLLIKLLNDYFVKSDLTGTKYGSFAKKTIT